MALPIALVTCDTLPGLTHDGQVLAQTLAQAGVEVQTPIWNDPLVYWSDFAGAIIRSTWDYHLHVTDFKQWLNQVDEETPLWNPTQLIRWNMQKTYLQDLAAQNIPIVPTVWLAQGSEVYLATELLSRGWVEGVLKPVISATAYQTRRVSVATMEEDQIFLQENLTQRDYMLQSFIPEIQTRGEWSFVFFNDGEQVHFSHALRKVPQDGDYRVQEEYGAIITQEQAAPNLMRQAEAVVAAIPHDWLYVRVDAVELDGVLTLMELELIEPALYLYEHPPAYQLFADCILKRLNIRTFR